MRKINPITKTMLMTCVSGSTIMIAGLTLASNIPASFANTRFLVVSAVAIGAVAGGVFSGIRYDNRNRKKSGRPAI